MSGLNEDDGSHGINCVRMGLEMVEAIRLVVVATVLQHVQFMCVQYMYSSSRLAVHVLAVHVHAACSIYSNSRHVLYTKELNIVDFTTIRHHR